MEATARIDHGRLAFNRNIEPTVAPSDNCHVISNLGELRSRVHAEDNTSRLFSEMNAEMIPKREASMSGDVSRRQCAVAAPAIIRIIARTLS